MVVSNWRDFILIEFAMTDKVIIEESFSFVRDYKKAIINKESFVDDVEKESEANRINIYIRSATTKLSAFIFLTLSIDKLTILDIGCRNEGSVIQEAIFDTNFPLNFKFVYEDYDLSNHIYPEIPFSEDNCKLISKFLEIPKHVGWKEERWYLMNKEKDINSCFRSKVTVIDNNEYYVYNTYMVPSGINLLLSRLFFSILGLVAYFTLFMFLEKTIIEVKPLAK